MNAHPLNQSHVSSSYYDPYITAMIVTCALAIITFLWQPKTLADYRFARSGNPMNPQTLKGSAR